MSVHYKFKSALDFDTITFDGLHISVADLKKAIMQQKRLGKTADFDLQITNAQTKEEYAEDSCLIPKNTSLTIARIPLANQVKKQWNPQEDSNANAARQTESEQVHVDLSRMNGTEEDKIAAMMMQSTMDYDPNNYQRLRQNQTGEVPPNYRCFKCHQPGHWIKNCPQGTGEGSEPFRKTTGIPRSFINDQKQAELEAKPVAVPVEKKPEIPEDLICSICKDLFTDAVMIPCCGSSFCDECVRTALLESEDNECPDCHEKGSSPGSLIPNRFLRTSVNSFRNETGYNNRPRPQTAPVAVPPRQKPVEPVKEQMSSPQIQEESLPPIENSRDVSPDRKSNASSRSEVSHAEKDDSEDDDNITVTVPPAHAQSRSAFRDRQVNGGWGMRGGYGPRYNNHQPYNAEAGRGEEKDGPPGEPPTRGDRERDQQPPPHRNERERDRERDREHSHGDMPQSRPPHNTGPGGDHHQQQPPMGENRYNRPMYNDQRYENMHYQNQGMNPYGGPSRMNYEGNNGNGGPNMMGQQFNRGGPNQGGYNHHGGPRFPNAPNSNYGMRQGGGPGPGMGGGPGQGNRGPMNPELSNIYQGVAAKVGTGIIDDPLEAFNRIMREKEMRKEERRARSPGEQRRSRSIERRRGSPAMERRGHGSPRRSPDRRMRGGDRRRRSSSYSSSRSRSRSRPPRNRSRSPMRKRSRSPPMQMRRSRSRSPPFDQRNRGRDMNRHNDNFHRDGRNFNDHHQHQHQMQMQQQQHGNNFNRGRMGPGGPGPGNRGWNNNNPRYGNEQQNPQFFNNNHGNYEENFMHHEQHYQQNRFDRDHHPHQQQQQQQQYYNDHNQFMDRRSPNDQPPVPGVDDDRPPMQQQQQPHRQQQQQQPHGSGRPGDQPPMDHRRQQGPPRPTGSRSVSPSRDSRQKEFSGDRRRKSKSPSSRHPQREVKGESSSSKDRRDHREAADGEGRGSSGRSRSVKKPSNTSRADSRGREEKKSSTSRRSSREKERKRESPEPESRKVKEKDRKRDSSEPESKKAKDKMKKKKKTSEKDKEKEKKKSKKEKKEKKVKDTSLKKSAEEAKSGTDPEQTGQKSDEETEQREIGKSDSESREDRKVAESTPNSHRGGEEEVNEEQEKLNTSSPGNAENPSDSVLDIYGNMDYERELEDMTDVERNNKQEQASEMPVLSKWERDDTDDQSAGEEKAIKSGNAPEEEPEDGEIAEDNKVTNEVLKRAENALFSRAINAIRPSMEITAERKRLYSGEITEKVLVTKSSSSSLTQSPELKPNVQITVATQRSSSRERCVEMVEQKGSRASSPTGQQARKLSVKERLGTKVSDERHPRRRSPSPARRVKITTTVGGAGDEGRARNSDREREREKEKDRERERDRERDKETVRRDKSPLGGGRNNVRGNNSGDRRGGDQRGDRDRERERERERDRDRERDRMNQREKNSGHNKDSGRDRADRMRQGGRSRSRSVNRGGGGGNRRDDPQEQTRRRSRDRREEKERRDVGDRKDHQADRDRERKRSRTKTPSRDAKKAKREEVQPPSKRTEERNKDEEKEKEKEKERKKQPIDESNFEPDYEQMEADQAKDDKNVATVEVRKPIEAPKRDEELKKKSETPGSSSDDSSDSSSDSEDGEDAKKRRKKSKHSKKSKKKKKSADSDSEERKKSSKSKSKKSKKKKKHKHK